MPPPATNIARRHYEDQQLLAARAAVAATRAWASIDEAEIAASWAQRIPSLSTSISAAQRVAAESADTYVAEALAAGGGPVVEPAGEVLAAGFAGVASDGRTLDTLLAQPAITTLRAISVGVDVGTALDVGLAALGRIVATQVADAGRVADGVAIAIRHGAGYVRMLNPPACSRCAVLAGRRYRWNQGFLRHPRCDCRHIPIAENIRGSVTTNPRAYFDSLTSGEQNRIFTNAGAQAIRDGADVGQVVNARRGITTAGTTTEGTTRRGFAGRRLEREGAATERRRVGTRTVQTARGPQQRTVFETRATGRLMPERIYELAGDDRDLAVQLLRQHGFVA